MRAEIYCAANKFDSNVSFTNLIQTLDIAPSQSSIQKCDSDFFEKNYFFN